MVVEYLTTVSETGMYQGSCVTVVYCKSISTGRLYVKSVTNIGFTPDANIFDPIACPKIGNQYYERQNLLCNGVVVGYQCVKVLVPGRNDESITNKNEDRKEKTYLVDLLNSLINSSIYLIPKSVNEKTTVTEFEKLMSETKSFDINDLVEYKMRNTFINTSEKAINNLKVFPNPFNQSFTIEIDNQNVSKAAISVYNSLGQRVMSNNHNLAKGKNVITMDAKQLNESIYILEVIDEKGIRMSQKILKSNR